MFIVNYLKQISSKIYLTTYLDQENIDIIMKSQKSWLDFPVLSYKDPLLIEEFLRTQTDSYFMVIDGNFDLLTSLAVNNPSLVYILIKNSNYKCKNSFEEIKNPLIHAFLGFEDIEFPKILEG